MRYERQKAGIISDEEALVRRRLGIVKGIASLIKQRAERTSVRLSQLASLLAREGPLSAVEVEALGFNHVTVSRYFGSWNGFLKALGHAPNVPGLWAERWRRAIEKRLGRSLLRPDGREWSFAWLLSPSGFKLRVDGFDSASKTVFEFDDSSHSDLDWYSRRMPAVEAIAKFTKRKMLDNVRDVLIPRHGLRLVRISHEMLPTEENLVKVLAGIED